MRIITLISLFTLITAEDVKPTDNPMHYHLRLKNSPQLKDFLSDSKDLNYMLYFAIVFSIIVSIILSIIYFSEIKKGKRTNCNYNYENYKNSPIRNYNFDLANNPNTTLYYMIRERNAVKSQSLISF
jgi:hypothetical protein